MSAVQAFFRFTGDNSALTKHQANENAHKQTHWHILRAGLSLGEETELW